MGSVGWTGLLVKPFFRAALLPVTCSLALPAQTGSVATVVSTSF